ncbi:hypothetical protein ACH5RR_024567 [Cinchona calisaya]|uniref:TPR1-like CTLH-containing domain-containing protein n=1 Tax=Cinchona calisaya TaxID=153742 RepID=A0ABD2YX25_9GENT
MMGNYDILEDYVHAFKKFGSHPNFDKILEGIKKQKYMEAVLSRDKEKSVHILNNEWKPSIDEMNLLVLEITHFESRDVNKARKEFCQRLKEWILDNPVINQKLKFPKLRQSGLLGLWTHVRQKAYESQQSVQPPADVSGVKRARTSDSPESSKQLMDISTVLRLSEQTGGVQNMEKPKIFKVTEMNEASQLLCLKIHNGDWDTKIIRLVYANSGRSILSLADNAVQRLWKWSKTGANLTGEATPTVPPQFWKPWTGELMINDISESNAGEVFSCLALSENSSHAVSTSGGNISLFNMITFQKLTTFKLASSAATCIAFHPGTNDVLAIGMNDSSIRIYNILNDEESHNLKFHQKRVTGLAFSNNLRILVSLGADAQICVWTMDGWEKKDKTMLQVPYGSAPNPFAQAHVQFHQDQTRILVIHKTLIAVYEVPKLYCIRQCPQQSGSAITDATYSCNGHLIYASYEDGSICVLSAATLNLRCRINPTTYLPPNPSLRAHPTVIAAHPLDGNQFAVGLSDGGIHVFEPLESQGVWDASPEDSFGVS